MPHQRFRLAPIDVISIKPNPALYEEYGCTTGVFISRIKPTSVFYDSTVNENCFITAVNGVPIDSFGVGRTEQFLGDPIPFASLLMMSLKSPGQNAIVTTCGMKPEEKNVSHSISMEWIPEKYEMGIRGVPEPSLPEGTSTVVPLEYELFAGITFMQMTVNHVITLVSGAATPVETAALLRWLLPENQDRKRLIITNVAKGTYASKVLRPGMVIEEVNGAKISDLDSYRENFKPKEGDYWKLVTDRGVRLDVNFNEEVLQQVTQAQLGSTYMFTQAVVRAAQDLKDFVAAQQAEIHPDSQDKAGSEQPQPDSQNPQGKAFPEAQGDSAKKLHESLVQTSSSRGAALPPGDIVDLSTRMTRHEAIATSEVEASPDSKRAPRWIDTVDAKLQHLSTEDLLDEFLLHDVM
jgi:hypothetical protein